MKNTAKYTPAKANTIDFAADISEAIERLAPLPKIERIEEYESDGIKMVGFFDKDGNQIVGMDKRAYDRMRRQQIHASVVNAAKSIGECL